MLLEEIHEVAVSITTRVPFLCSLANAWIAVNLKRMLTKKNPTNFANETSHRLVLLWPAAWYFDVPHRKKINYQQFSHRHKQQQANRAAAASDAKRLNSTSQQAGAAGPVIANKLSGSVACVLGEDEAVPLNCSKCGATPCQHVPAATAADDVEENVFSTPSMRTPVHQEKSPADSLKG